MTPVNVPGPGYLQGTFSECTLEGTLCEVHLQESFVPTGKVPSRYFVSVCVVSGNRTKTGQNFAIEPYNETGVRSKRFPGCFGTVAASKSPKNGK
jgi:hypothetical protein